jgi:hypothetical protein
MIEISATSGVGGFSNAQNSRTASAVVQKLLDIFVEENLAGNRAETGQSLDFLDQELKRREAQLQEAEQRRVEFETKYLGVLPGEGSVQQRMSSARMELANIDQQLMAAQGALSSIARPARRRRPPPYSTPSFGGVRRWPLCEPATRRRCRRRSPSSRAGADREPPRRDRHQRNEIYPPPPRRRRRALGCRQRVVQHAQSRLRIASARCGRAPKPPVARRQMRKNQIQAAMAELVSKQSSEPGVVAEQARLNRRL